MATSDDPIRPSQPMDPVEHPLDPLIRDHELVRKLADRYCNTQNKEVQKQAGKQIVEAVHTHSRVEEAVFYPGVRQIDPAMIGHFEQDHAKVDDLVATLQAMTLDEPDADRLMRELITSVLHHIEQEEKEFFPKLERAGFDMAPVGLQMQAFEANLVATQAQMAEARPRR